MRLNHPPARSRPRMYAAERTRSPTDSIFMTSRSLRVDAIEHNFDDAVSAGSDHAYVLAQPSLC